jgi:Tfp pilus assembly protein FimT
MELVIVVGLTAILVAAAIPAFTATIQNRRLNGAVMKIVSDLRYAQSMAVSQGGVVRLQSGNDPLVNPPQPGRYRLERSANGGAPWNPLPNSTWYLLASEFPAATIVSIQDSAGNPQTVYEVRFTSRGMVNNAGVTYPIVINVSGEAGARTIQIRQTGNLGVI